MADDETLDDKINKIFAERIKTELSNTENLVSSSTSSGKSLRSKDLLFNVKILIYSPW